MRINVVAVFGVRRVNFNLVEYRPGRDLDPDFRARWRSKFRTTIWQREDRAVAFHALTHVASVPYTYVTAHALLTEKRRRDLHKGEDTMKRVACTLVASLGMLLYASAPLQTQGMVLNKKFAVTVMLPASVLTREGTKAGLTRAPIYGVEIVQFPDGHPIPKDKPDWRTSGFPMLVEMKLEKLETKDGLTGVEYRSLPRRDPLNGLVIKFRMARGLNAEEMLRPFLIGFAPVSNEVQTHLSETYRLIASRVFTGPLASVAGPEQLALVKLAHVTAKGIGLTAESYKDNTYLAVDLEDDGNVYNTLKLNEGQRLSKVINERLLSLVKAFAVPLKTSSLIYGVKLHTVIRHEDFLNKSGTDADKDDVSIYAPAELIRKFADATN
jgi:hypothetical protein